MPTYKVIAPGFYLGSVYEPGGKRQILTVDKPFKKCPSWLKIVKAETPAQKKKRETAEKKNLDEAKKKADQDQEDITGANFIENQESVVTTL